jgi:SagB-type dehydrogenase family enzyme
VRVRRSKALTLTFDGPGLLACNFLAEDAVVVLDDLSLEILAISSDWLDVSVILSHFSPRYAYSVVYDLLAVLLDRQIIVGEGSAAAEKDSAFESEFEWGLAAGYYHFSIKNPRYMTPEQMSLWLTSRVAAKPPVPLFTTNEQYTQVTSLPKPSSDGVFKTMRERRSYRGFDNRSIGLSQLTDCLFSGFGITHFVGTLTPGEGHLPLTMTPSAGARNPYEGYVYAQRVDGLGRGIYHYSALDNTLGLVTECNLPTIGDLLANQPWFNNAAATIILVANFGRTSWKYPHPTGYRVVLIEAGHIVQNIALAATEHSLASAPTCAVADNLIEQLLRLDSIKTSPIYTISLGNRSDTPTDADTIDIRPNPLTQDGVQ